MTRMLGRRLLAAATMIALATAGGGGCAGGRPGHPVNRSTASAQPHGPVIVHLVSRHQALTVTSSPSGPRYSARASNGTPIVANATLDELRTDHPEIYRLLHPGVAADAGAARVPVLADLRPEPPLMLDARR